MLRVINGCLTSLECTANGAALYDCGSTLLHTNHPLASRDIDPHAQLRLEKAGFNASSHRRLDWLRDRAETLHGAGEMQTLFGDADAPICMRAQYNGGSSTFASALFEITDAPIVKMRKGHTGGAEWQHITFL